MGQVWQFWIPAAGMVALIAAVLLRALGATARPVDAGEAALRIHRDLLAEVERDIALGRIPANEGAHLRAEAARRLLGASRDTAPPAPGLRPVGTVAAGLILGALVAAALAYVFYLGAPGYPDLPLSERLARAEAAYNARPAQAEIEAAAGQKGTPPSDPAEAALLDQLRAAVALRPDHLEGHKLLARSESAIGNHAGARAALQRVVDLSGSNATAADHVQLAEAMILAAGGLVTAQAEAALVAALNLDPSNGPALYYSGLMLAQVGRPDQAFALWRPLLETSAPDAPWSAPIRDGIVQLAQAAGIRYDLPAALPGPDAAAVEAAGALSADDRNAMIAGMVDGLEQRLLAQGGSAEEWARLVTSLGVLGEAARQSAALEAASEALAADPAGLAAVNAAASSDGGAAP